MNAAGILAVSLALLVGCGSQRQSAEQAVEELDPLNQATVAFIGNPASRDIKAAMDTAFASTGTPSTDENYSRAGSTLVALRKRNGGTEMETLRCIPSRVGDPRIPDRTFPSVAVLCSLTTTGAMP